MRAVQATPVSLGEEVGFAERHGARFLPSSPLGPEATSFSLRRAILLTQLVVVFRRRKVSAYDAVFDASILSALSAGMAGKAAPGRIGVIGEIGKWRLLLKP
jgi:hypothetical protein